MDLEKCSGCSYAYYCSEKCQNEDHDNHVLSGECDILKERPYSNILGNSDVRFLLRIFLKLRLNDNNSAANIVDKVPWKKELRSFRDLLDHFDDIVLRSPSNLSSAEECYSGTKKLCIRALNFLFEQRIGKSQKIKYLPSLI